MPGSTCWRTGCGRSCRAPARSRDLVSRHGFNGAAAKAARDAFVAMLAGVLRTCRSPVCVESALHGLGHLVGSTGGVSGEVIRAWLQSGVEVPPETRAYAVASAEGTIP